MCFEVCTLVPFLARKVAFYQLTGNDLCAPKCAASMREGPNCLWPICPIWKRAPWSGSEKEMLPTRVGAVVQTTFAFFSMMLGNRLLDTFKSFVVHLWPICTIWKPAPWSGCEEMVLGLTPRCPQGWHCHAEYFCFLQNGVEEQTFWHI